MFDTIGGFRFNVFVAGFIFRLLRLVCGTQESFRHDLRVPSRIIERIDKNHSSPGIAETSAQTVRVLQQGAKKPDVSFSILTDAEWFWRLIPIFEIYLRS